MQESLSDLIKVYQENIQDTSIDSKTIGIGRMNRKQKQLLATHDFFFMKKTKVINTVANTQVYDLPVDYDKFSSAFILIGGTKYPIDIIQDQGKFDDFDSQGTTYISDYIQFLHIRDNKIYVSPTPNTNGLPIYFNYKRKYRNMELEDYVTGSVSVTNGSKTVTGAGGAAWITAGAKAGCTIFIRGVPYLVENIATNTSLTLEIPYEGSTESGVTDYKLADCPIIPAGYSDLLPSDASALYYVKRDPKSYQIFKNESISIEKQLIIYGRTNTTDIVKKYTRRIPLDKFRRGTFTIN